MARQTRGESAPSPDQVRRSHPRGTVAGLPRAGRCADLGDLMPPGGGIIAPLPGRIIRSSYVFSYPPFETINNRTDEMEVAKISAGGGREDFARRGVIEPYKSQAREAKRSG